MSSSHGSTALRPLWKTARWPLHRNLDIKGRQTELRRRLTALLGEAHAPLPQSYDETLRAEMELSARHFFQEGFRAGQELSQSAT